MAQVDSALLVYSQAPFYRFLRFGCCPLLAWVVAKEFRNAEFVQEVLSGEQNQGAPTQATNVNVSGKSNSATNVQNQRKRPQTLYDFLYIVDKKGKRQEDKNRKRVKKGHIRSTDDIQDEEAAGAKILHVINLNVNKTILSKIQFLELLNGNDDDLKKVAEILEDIDPTFLLNVLCNNIIKFQFRQEVKEAICRIKNVRNKVSHSGLECEEKTLLDHLNTLCKARRVLCRVYFFDPLENLEKECLGEAEDNAGSLAKEILQRLKGEIRDCYKPVRHNVFPSIKYSGEDKSPETLEKDLPDFVRKHCKANSEQQDSRPLLLFGSSGVGKSFIKDHLAYILSNNPQASDPLVINLSRDCCNQKPRNLWQQVINDLEILAPETIGMYATSAVICALRQHTGDILFLADWNVQCLSDVRCGTNYGTWLITHCGAPEDEPSHHYLTVEEFTPTQVEQMLTCLYPDPEQNAKVLNAYQSCNFKGLLTRPDIICVFAELRCKENLTFCRMVKYYVESHVPHERFKDDLKRLGKLAFESIRYNKGKFYSQHKINNVPSEVRNPFMVQEDSGLFFRYRVVEDYLASLYILSDPEKACFRWLSQYPLFKRVFRFVSWSSCSNTDGIQAMLPYLKEYLIKFLDIPISSQQEDMEVDEFEGEKNNEMDDKSKKRKEPNTEEESRKNCLSKWPYLMKLADDCKFHPDVMDMLAKLVAQKPTWRFKSRALTDSDVEKLPKLLSLVVPTCPIIIKLESGCNVTLITRVWEILSAQPRLYPYVTVEFLIIHNETLPLQYRKRLMFLAKSIAKSEESSDGSLVVTKYVGPLVCSDTPQFLRCLSMQKLEVLDVRVCDKITLAEMFACEGLSSLSYLGITVTLKVHEQCDITSALRMRIPCIQTVPLYLTIQYFPGIQNLLNHIDSPECLTYLSLRHVFIHQNFHLDLSRFTGLSCLFLWFELKKLEPLPPICLPDISSPTNIEMAEYSEEETEKSEADEQVSYRDWALKLNHYLRIPSCLQRLMLRNAAFIDDSNHFLVDTFWREYGVRRILVLDTDLSPNGANSLLKSYTDFSSSQKLEHDFKRICRVNDGTRSDPLYRRLRLEKSEREKLKRSQAGRELGQELVVTSENTNCDFCCVDPWQCKGLNIDEYCKKMITVVELVNKAYNYSGQSFSFYSPVLKVRRDVCGDVRVHCPLTHLDDHAIAQPQEHKWLTVLLGTVSLVHFICFERTQLTQRGIMALVEKIWACKEKLLVNEDGTKKENQPMEESSSNEKKLAMEDCGNDEMMEENCADKEKFPVEKNSGNKKSPESFSLVVSSFLHPTGHDQTEYSHLVNFLKKTDKLVQFYFKCCCKLTCQHYLRRAYNGAIYLNNKCIFDQRDKKSS